MNAETVIRQAADKWPSSFVARTMIREFSGGAVSPGYLANLDSAGKGPAGSFKIGRMQCYPVESLVSWLIARARQ